MPYKDPEAKRRRDASYRRDRRAELAAKQRHYYQWNRESTDARNAAWIEAKPDARRVEDPLMALTVTEASAVFDPRRGDIAVPRRELVAHPKQATP